MPRKRPTLVPKEGSSVPTSPVPEGSPGPSSPGVAESAYAWCFPPEATAAATAMGVPPGTEHPYWKAGGRVIAPQAALRTAGRLGYSPRYVSAAQQQELDDEINSAFVGATLCGCITIEKHLMNGGYGRGWKAAYKQPGTDDPPQTIFIKTLGVGCSDTLETDYALDCERKARVEAKVYTHRWFAAAVDQPGAACQRLCYGLCENPKTGFKGEIFFVSGEFCAGDDLWAYQPHKESFKEEFGQRIMGQLARGLCTMKHSGQLERFHRGEIPLGAAAEAADGPIVKGCFHRDVKLENIIVSGDFDTKIMDYGSLKFTDDAEQEVGGKLVKYTTKTPWHGTDVFKPPSFFYTDEFTVKTDGYDPAAWDVWSLGTVLLYIVGGATLYAKLRGDVYRFFEVTLQVRPRTAADGVRWDQKRKKVGNQNLFYSTDKTGKPNKMDKRGIPIVPTKKAPAVGGHNPSGGIPTNPDLWKFLAELDPDARRGGSPTAFSRELKDLLNRMLDVDPERRITIEDVCQHPWLRSHQSHGDESVVETAEQRELFRSEMHRRFEKYINKQSGTEDVRVSLTSDQTVEFVSKYAAFEGGLFVRKADELGPNVIDVHRSKDAAGSSPMVRAEGAEGTPRFPIYRVYTLPGKLTLQWMNSKTVEINGEAINESATLAEWSHFKETLLFMAENPELDLLHDESEESEGDGAAAAAADPK